MDTFEAAVVGMHFRGGDAKQIAAGLTAESPLTLQREPENEFDPFALKVMFYDQHIGYIERTVACWISPLLDEGQIVHRVKALRHEERGRNFHPILEIMVGAEGEELAPA